MSFDRIAWVKLDQTYMSPGANRVIYALTLQVSISDSFPTSHFPQQCPQNVLHHVQTVVPHSICLHLA